MSNEICEWMERRAITHIFFVPGSQIEPLCIELSSDPRITTIVACHELGAGFMADGYTRASLNVGVCASIGGPGASYMLPSAIVSRVDGIAVLYITGDVPVRLKNRLYFQDTTNRGSRDKEVYKTAIDYSKTITHACNTSLILKEIDQRLDQRLPAHLVIPYDVQQLTCVPERNYDPEFSSICIFDDPIMVAGKLVEMINKAVSPVILIGHQFYTYAEVSILNDFIDLAQIPFATTYRAKGMISEKHRLSLGIFGYAGTIESYRKILSDKCDLLIMFGFDFTQRNTFSFHEGFLPIGRKGIVVNSRFEMKDSSEFPCEIFRVENVAFTLKNSLELMRLNVAENRLRVLQSQQSAILHESGESAIDKPLFDWVVSNFIGSFPPDTMIFVDSGSHRISTGTNCRISNPFTFFTSDSQAPVGWAICASIGAKLARPKSPVLVITGDGCMRMHGMEIATAVRYSLPIIFLVSNNSAYKSVYNRLKTKKAKDDFASLPTIDWAKFAESIGAEGCTIKENAGINPIMAKARKTKIPLIIDIRSNLEEDLPANVTMPDSLWPLD